MDIRESVEQLLHYEFDLAQREVNLFTFQQSSQVVLTELKDKVYSASITVVRSGCVYR